MNISDYILTNRTDFLAPPIKCASGLQLSVQASKGHYCSPRDDKGPYTKVEVGFPSQIIEALFPYNEGLNKDPRQNVYAYVPVSLVEQVIADNGGVA